MSILTFETKSDRKQRLTLRLANYRFLEAWLNRLIRRIPNNTPRRNRLNMLIRRIPNNTPRRNRRLKRDWRGNGAGRAAPFLPLFRAPNLKGRPSLQEKSAYHYRI